MKKTILALALSAATLPFTFAAQAPSGNQTSSSDTAKTAKHKKHHSKKGAKTDQSGTTSTNKK